jgi:hypothetical protein
MTIKTALNMERIVEARKGETERLHMELIAARNKLVVEY